ncbi:MAG TPA: ABC transporter ATP-binding protein [Thermodesulfobacteriota bacterium]|nr:ABC transporter ATP-binding protein [Thermodesulfobacteriota bacterium]
MLEVKNLNVSYGVIPVLHDVSLSIQQNELVALLGSNGAGKSTLLNTIQGIVKPSSGRILFLGKPIENLPTHKIITAGIAQVPEGRRLFPYMTVKENLLLGAYPGKAWQVKQERMKWVMELFPILKERANMASRLLSGGEQQMLTIGRGLMAQPRLLMVDEPSLGLAPVIQDHLYQTLGKLRQSKITILLPEQNALRALGIANRGYVMQDGKIVLEGDAASLMQSDLVKKAYLGR